MDSVKWHIGKLDVVERRGEMVLMSGPAHPPHGGHYGEESAASVRKPVGSGAAERHISRCGRLVGSILSCNRP